jgi:predicted amidohydrolase YtcJ
MRGALILVVGVGCAGHGRAADPPRGDAGTFLVAHAQIWGRADDAVLARGDKIVAVGRTADLEARCSAPCARVDATGRFLVPGFHDAHVHLYGAGMEAQQLEVPPASIPEIQRAVREWAAAHPNDAWIFGRGWNAGSFRALPTHADLDVAVGDRPVVLTDRSGHTLWANGAAMALASVGPRSQDPRGGKIQRDPSGAPTGIFEDAAKQLVLDKAPSPSDEAVEAAILSGEATSLAAGITSSDGGPVPLAVARAYARLDGKGKLRQRTFLWAPLRAGERTFREWVDFAHALPAEGKVRVVAFKGFVDGVFATRTSALLEPYADEPANRGTLHLEADEIAKLTLRANGEGFAVALHAQGDRAVRVALDGFAKAPAPKGIVNRVEHASLVDPADVPRFHALGVAASVQPIWLSETRSGWASRLGPERAGRLYPWRALAAAGATLLFGSDLPSARSLDPVAGMAGAVTRKTETGALLGPEQALDPDAALRAFTEAPADAIGAGAWLGRVAPGYAADLVLLERDPRGARSLAEAPIAAMWIGGARVR